MHTFPELIRQIRDEADLTQTELAKKLGVSAVLIAMVETGQKEASKKLLLKLAKALDVHPVSITPFMFITNESTENISKAEQFFINAGEKMQTILIKNRAKKLKNYAE